MCFVGIDPGITGAVAWLDGEGALFVEDIPVVDIGGRRKRRVVNAAAFVGLMHRIRSAGEVRMVVIEEQQAMPKQGVASSFAIGRNYGVLLGAVAALELPLTTVRPDRWKKVLSVPASKDGARARASELFPGAADMWSRASQHGRAEAALLAWFASRIDAGEGA